MTSKIVWDLCSTLLASFPNEAWRAERTKALAGLESLLEHSRLAREDYFYRAPRNDREREWVFENRSDAARHWILSDLRVGARQE